MSKQEDEIICPKCGEICNWISTEKGKKWCYHYYGLEKDENGKTRKKVKKHYLGVAEYSRGSPGEQSLNEIERKINSIKIQLSTVQNEEEKQRLERILKDLEKTRERMKERRNKLNIHLRPVSDKGRFLEYIKESLELMKEQNGFNEENILQVLDVIDSFLKENKQVISEKTLAKIRLIENDVAVTIYSKQVTH